MAFSKKSFLLRNIFDGTQKRYRKKDVSGVYDAVACAVSGRGVFVAVVASVHFVCALVVIASVRLHHECAGVAGFFFVRIRRGRGPVGIVSRYQAVYDWGDASPSVASYRDQGASDVFVLFDSAVSVQVFQHDGACSFVADGRHPHVLVPPILPLGCPSGADGA